VPGKAAGGPGSGAVGAGENAAGRRPGAAQPGYGGSPAGSRSDDASRLRLCLDLTLDALLLTLGAAASDPACATSHPSASGPIDPPAADWGTATTAPDALTPVAVDRLIDLTTDPPTVCLAAHVPASTPGGAARADATPDAPAPDPAHPEARAGQPRAGQPAAAVPPWQRWLHEDVEITRALARELLAWGGALPSSLGQAGSPTATLAVLDRLEARHLELRSLAGDVKAFLGTDPVEQVGSGTSSAVNRPQTVIRHCQGRLTELELLRTAVETAVMTEAEQAHVAGTTPAPATPSCQPGEFLG
jgi:hypothetical protein